ncbi:hypothetical protein [Bacillus sp. UNC41MFS5]|nr:hypothetical protein [Bacillus sp. UNC41MFS5]
MLTVSVDKKAGHFHKAVTGSTEKWKKTEIIKVEEDVIDGTFKELIFRGG